MHYRVISNAASFLFVDWRKTMDQLLFSSVKLFRSNDLPIYFRQGPNVWKSYHYYLSTKRNVIAILATKPDRIFSQQGWNVSRIVGQWVTMSSPGSLINVTVKLCFEDFSRNNFQSLAVFLAKGSLKRKVTAMVCSLFSMYTFFYYSLLVNSILSWSDTILINAIFCTNAWNFH